MSGPSSSSSFPSPSPTKTKIIVLDDDPTGSQTVHSCWLLTRWDVETLRDAILDETSPLFFVLTNTRGMSAIHAAELTREICRNIHTVLKDHHSEMITPILVSRSDSTLRGHYPVETNVLAEELGPFNAHFLVPAFFQGGRVTINSTHYLKKGDTLVPCHETEFAKDSVFGYSTAYLPEYVQEKTKGLILAKDVERFLLKDIRDEGDGLSKRISNLSNNVCCVVDAETQDDLDRFASQLLAVASRDQRTFLFRSGASLLTALARLPPAPVSMEEMSKYALKDDAQNVPLPGVILVGSHVPTSTRQLEHVLKEPTVIGVEVDVTDYDASKDHDDVVKHLTEEIRKVLLHDRRHLVLYTSRTERQFPSHDARLSFGQDVSNLLMDLIRDALPPIGFLISKGGITSNDVLSSGLELHRSRVVGQILAGCSVVQCPAAHPTHPHLPVVIFPGNVGDEYGLVTVLRRMSVGGQDE